MTAPVDRVVLALDQGTSSSRALVVDARAQVLGLAQQPVEVAYPRPGWVEQDAAAVWRTQREVAREALTRSGVSAERVAAVGVTVQRETTVVWERAGGRPVAPAIVWQDRRTADACARLKAAGAEALVRRRTGLLLDPYFSATKLRWLLEHVPHGVARAEAGELAFGTIDTWLAWNLSGGRLHVTDATNASRTLLYDLADGDWHDELLELFGVPRALLPEIRHTSGVMGETEAELLGRPLPLAALVGDQQAALFGQVCLARGGAKVTYGTGCFLLVHSGERPPPEAHGLLRTVAVQRPAARSYALEGSAFIGGAAVQWLHEGLGLADDAAGVERLAASVPHSDGVMMVPALAGLGAPHWEPQARGAILGLTRGSSAAHVARATLEGIALQVADLVAAAADAGVSITELRADGGASVSDLLLQTQADVLGVPVVRAAQPEATAMGAAWLAGLAVGVWADDEDVAALWRPGARFEPQAHAATARLLDDWRRAVAAVRGYAASRGDVSR